MSNPRVAIHTDGLTKAYEDVLALQDLNLVVPKHSVFGFLGPNGAGKTTTMKLLLGLSRPSGGSATVLGQDSVRDSIAIRARIGYLPQQPKFPRGMTAREVLRFVAHFFYSRADPAIETRIEELLRIVDLADKADRKVDKFSGGERQRLGLAQAQINAPELLILDEPAAALDPIGRNEVLRIMERLREHATVFYSTHILDDVQQVSDTVAILNRGRLVAQGPIMSLLSGPGEVVYQIAMKGDIQRAYERVAGEPWVAGIKAGNHRDDRNGEVTWHVGVASGAEQAAEQRLLRVLLADEHLVVTHFSRTQVELEQVFIDLVSGASQASPGIGDNHDGT